MIVDGSVITADDGMILTNGETYSKKVFLGINDSPENWREIPEEDVPPEPIEPTDEELNKSAQYLLSNGLAELPEQEQPDYLNENEPETNYFE